MAQSTSESIDEVLEELEQETLVSTEETTEFSTETVSETELFNEVVYLQATEIDEQILAQIKVSNNLLGISIAFQIFFLGLFFVVFFIKIIKNNIINFF